MNVLRLNRAVAFAATAGVIALAGCSGAGSGGSGGGVVSDACAVNNTATMRFENTSSSEGYDVLLDGATIGSVASTHSIAREVAAGTHSVGWFFAGTTSTACPTSTGDIAACATETFSCAAVDLLRCLHQNFGTVFAQNTHGFRVTATIDARPYFLDPFEGVSVRLEAGVAHEISFSGPEGVLCNPVSFILEPCQKRIFRC